MHPEATEKKRADAPQSIERKPIPPRTQQWFTFLGGEIFGPLTHNEMHALVSEGRLTLQSETTRRTPLEWKSAGADELLAAFFSKSALGSLPLSASPVNFCASPLLAVRPPAKTEVTTVDDRRTKRLPVEPNRYALRTPLIMGLISLALPGLGQLVYGFFIKALAFGFGAILLWGIGLGWIVHIWAAIDASQSADRNAEGTHGRRGAAHHKLGRYE